MFKRMYILFIYHAGESAGGGLSWDVKKKVSYGALTSPPPRIKYSLDDNQICYI